MVPTELSGSSSSWMLLRPWPLALETAMYMAEAGKVTAVPLGVTPKTSDTAERFTLCLLYTSVGTLDARSGYKLTGAITKAPFHKKITQLRRWNRLLRQCRDRIRLQS